MILIGIGKLLKATGLIFVGFGIHYILAEPYRSNLDHWLEWAGQDPHSHLLYNSLNFVMGVSIAKLRLFRIGVFVYASLYGAEGIGVLMEKRWAEWMVVITTAGFIPWEIYELSSHFEWWKPMLLGLNVLAMGYLIFRLERLHTIKKELGVRVRG